MIQNILNSIKCSAMAVAVLVLAVATTLPPAKTQAIDGLMLADGDNSTTQKQTEALVDTAGTTVDEAACTPTRIYPNVSGPNIKTRPLNDNIFVDWSGQVYLRVSADCAREVKVMGYIVDQSPSPGCAPEVRGSVYRKVSRGVIDGGIQAGTSLYLSVNYFGPESNVLASLTTDSNNLTLKCIRQSVVTLHAEGYYRNNLDAWVPAFCKNISIPVATTPTGLIYPGPAVPPPLDNCLALGM